MARAGYGDLEVGAETSSVQAVHPVGTEAAPGIAFSTDTDVGLYRAGANQLGISVSGTGQVVIVDGVLQPVTTNDIDLGTADLQFKNAWFDGTLEADVITVGGVSVATGTNATTITTTANNANETVYPTFVDGTSSSQDIEVDTGLTYNPSSGLLTITGELDAGSLDISGSADIDGTMEADAYTVDGTTLAEYISDTVGGMVTGNTESGITVAYQDADNTIDFTVGTLNQNTTGSAATLTTARDIGGVSFNGSASIDLPGVNTGGNQATSGLAGTATLAASATKLATTRAIGGVNFDGTAPIDLPGVNTAGNQATSGLAATATTAALATEVTIVANNTTDETVYPTFVDGATGTQGVETDTGFTYNPSTGALTATSFTGSVTGTITGTSSEVNVVANNSTDETVYPIFVDGATGSQEAESDTGLTYNPSTGLLTAAGFAGPITGALTGNASGTAATVTGGTQASITIVANVVEVGALDDGSITSGFGTIDIGSSALGSGAITSTGVVTGTGFTIGSAVIDEAELEILDGATVTTTELNLIDGNTSRGTTAVASGDGILINDAGTMAMTNVDTVSTYFAAHSVGGSNIATVGTIGTGTWQGTVIAEAYLPNAGAAVEGVVELAVESEITTGTDSSRAMPIDQYVASNRNVRYIFYRIIGADTDVDEATTVGGDFEFPFAGTIIDVGTFSDTAGSSGTQVVDIHKNGTTIMGTHKCDTETGEKTTRDASQQPVITVAAIAEGDILTFDVDTEQGTEAKGLTVRLEVRVT